ncbi:MULTISPECIES: TerB family tellurite resistance protein [Myroides]|uniref:TerB family tellurite resistance protein n=1 Tax=Myroides albus TaxID=2562892 RepID=A0A6I3LB68_9FLAO|nr:MULTISPECIES: TerB family tellurite resistance protein [Myroides]MTG96689.1 TerB family tellurite resistance protein [Myroides albus]MVX34701.1 TerB family tellurite resistance protein [Myroides sp. LoEW2-1]UVD80899.1 TerB family tellurite resistance protein [Myroides albus]
MAYSDLFDTGFKDRNRGHFASIVRVAFANGNFSIEEKKFIDQLADRLEISEDDYIKILENPEKFPVNPPYLEIHRIERLYDLARMVYVDHVLGKKQKDILKKFAVALGFTTEVDYLVDKALSLLVLDVDLETFIYEIKSLKR